MDEGPVEEIGLSRSSGIHLGHICGETKRWHRLAALAQTLEAGTNHLTDIIDYQGLLRSRTSLVRTQRISWLDSRPIAIPQEDMQ